jgi:HEAT repeat protein
MGKSFTLLDHEQDPRVFAILVRLAADDDEETRVKAAYALGDHPGPASRQVLATLEQDAAEWVRKAATHAIGRLDSFVDDDVELQRRLEQKRARPPGGQQAAGQAPEPTSEGEGQC